MPLLFLVVAVANSLTGGVFIWCLGVLQGILFPVVVLSNGRLGVLLGPAVLTISATAAAVTYMTLMRSDGADAVLEKTGAKDSKWLATVQDWASSYGVAGLFALTISPIPIPTAGIVVAAMLAKMDELKILAAVVSSKFINLILGAVALQYVVEGKSLEEYLREQFKGEAKKASGDGS